MAMKRLARYIASVRQARDVSKNIGYALIYLESRIYRCLKRKSSKKKVLIMRLDGLGDCIIFYPTLSAYRTGYPDTEITAVFPGELKSLSPLFPKEIVDRTVWVNQRSFASSFWYRRKLLLDLACARYDVFIYPVFARETIGSLIMKILGARESIGFDGSITEHGKNLERMGALPYTHLVKVPWDMKREIDRDAYFAEMITGKKVPVTFPTIDVKKLPDAKANVLLSECMLADGKQRYAIIFPGAGAPYRIWPTKNVARIIDYLAEKNILSVVCGGPKETGLVREISSLSKATLRPIDLSGKTDIATMAHILKSATLYFGSDTGILHLAVAVGTPAVAIVGMGGLDRFFPYGDERINRAVRDITHTWNTGDWGDMHLLKPGELHPSIENITVEQAQKEIDSVLEYCA